MAYNIPERYSDLTPAAKLDKKTLNKMVWMSCFLQASFNYEGIVNTRMIRYKTT